MASTHEPGTVTLLLPLVLGLILLIAAAIGTLANELAVVAPSVPAGIGRQ